MAKTDIRWESLMKRKLTVLEAKLEEDDVVLEENNKAWITGEVQDDFKFSHQTGFSRFYKSVVAVERKSGVKDYIPVIVNEELLPSYYLKGKIVEVGGQFRSYNRIGEDGKYHVDLFVFANYINVCEGKDINNIVYLNGTICKENFLGETSKGMRICRFLIAVNRAYAKSDYIPCVAWSGSALYVSRLSVGAKIHLYGRMQSREYIKRYEDGFEEKKTTYEVAVISIGKT